MIPARCSCSAKCFLVTITNADMKIFIICSKRFYDRIPPMKSELEAAGHTITLPNSYTDRSMEEKMRTQGAETHAKWKSEMIKQSCTNTSLKVIKPAICARETGRSTSIIGITKCSKIISEKSILHAMSLNVWRRETSYLNRYSIFKRTSGQFTLKPLLL